MTGTLDVAARPPLAVLSIRRMAAGNRLGPRPCVSIRVHLGDCAAVDAGAVGRRLSALAPTIGAAFQAVRPHLPADEGGTAAGPLGQLIVALMATGRPLAVAVHRLPQDGPDQRRVLVEEGDPCDLRLLTLGAAALLCHVLVPDAAEPSPAIRLLLDRATAAISGSSWNVLPAVLTARGVAWRAVDGPAGSDAFRVGEGWRQRRTHGYVASTTGFIGAHLAEDKARCSTLLRRLGLPAPPQMPVADREAAVAAARALGFPVVVKPVDRSGGAGVSTGLASAAEVGDAFDRAQRQSRRIIVEAMLPGDDHRFLVIGGHLVGVVCRGWIGVVGDGARTVRELLDAANAEPRRNGASAMLRPIRCDEQTDVLLARAGLSFAAVPGAGRVVQLQSAANWERGSVPEDVTVHVHPDNAAAVLQAVAAVGLDVAGVDFLSPDIRRSYREVGGGICEVNRNPGHLVHIAAGGAADAGRRFVDHLLADGSRIPILVVLGGAEADALAVRLAAGLEAAGLPTGLATAAGLVAAGLPLDDPGPARPERVERLVDDPAVRAVVVAADPEAIAAAGLGHGRADLAILTGPPGAARTMAADILRGLGAEVEVAREGVDPGPFAAAITARFAAVHRPAPR